MSYLEIANNLGVPVAMMVFMCVAATWIVRRVFGNNGLGTTLVAAHIVFLKRLELLTQAVLDREQAQSDLLQRTADATSKCYELHTKSDAPFSTQRLQRAGVKFTRLCEKILKQSDMNGDMNGEVQQILDEIRRELEQ